ncbi:TPA: conjugal transfer protein TraM [Legionella pneumophila]|uniref:conjugal transfer protein TraM n=1 Tax=Legionella pneumophila TaxID=446 RepID=UPI0013753215|nr:conjugal transfer protein TraM [Legionella pneumophila]HAT9326921.1 conjugal transfer protein TraM [Legionella pneumophila subsp. pneumophila]MCK1858734.1 conjugal transfer protein TraM [Legionella pneumophila]HAT1811121.1 conjugal transfer protein TraM [Legionella pneumophila]HAT2028478.1 conjugal transfer protein TraM [Legionella pneumophila]HAT8308141.1 conjugal transfer protein TraM [Legionella pneumophila]
MSEKTDKILQEIAIKHGVVLGKDDPILILQTMNDRLIEETRQAQAEMLAQFREEMEAISSRWKDDAKEKAEKVLNAALGGSKQLIVTLIQESANESTQAINKMLSDSLNQTRYLAQQSQRFSRLGLLLTSTILTLICSIILIKI